MGSFPVRRRRRPGRWWWRWWRRLKVLDPVLLALHTPMYLSYLSYFSRHQFCRNKPHSHLFWQVISLISVRRFLSRGFLFISCPFQFPWRPPQEKQIKTRIVLTVVVVVVAMLSTLWNFLSFCSSHKWWLQININYISLIMTRQVYSRHVIARVKIRYSANYQNTRSKTCKMADT